jgi:D-arabinose 1-dehydrogenase-like Zn-dependent alcohol dehydrogenase
MKALAKTGPQPGIELIEVSEPRPGGGDVLVEMKAHGACRRLALPHFHGTGRRALGLPPVTS